MYLHLWTVYLIHLHPGTHREQELGVGFQEPHGEEEHEA